MGTSDNVHQSTQQCGSVAVVKPSRLITV